MSGLTLPLLDFIPCVQEGPLLLLIMGLLTVFQWLAAGSPFKPGRLLLNDDIEKRLSVSKFLGL